MSADRGGSGRRGADLTAPLGPMSKFHSGGSVAQLHLSRRPCAVCTAVDGIFALDSVTYDAAVAVGASWRERVDGTFEAVEYMRLPADDDSNALS